MKCPACSRPVVAEPNQVSRCDSCGVSVFEIDGRIFDAAAYPRRIEAADVPRLLADALQRWRAAGRGRLLEVHRVSLPFWLNPDGQMTAAFPSSLDAVERLPAPVAEVSPAQLEERPWSSPPDGAVRLVLLPAFDVTYSVRGRGFHTVIDAHRGDVLADIQPPSWRVRIHFLVAAVLALDVAVFATACYFAPDGLSRFLIAAALVLPSYLFTSAAVRWDDRRGD